MKNHYQEKIEKKVLDHFQLLSAKGLKVLCIMLFTFYSGLVSAQNSVLFLTWNIEVGCVEGTNDPRDGKEYLELIEDGLCLRVCQRSTVEYTLHGSESNWLSVDWDVAGGTITQLSPDGLTCTVLWGNGIQGSIGATIVTTDGTRILPELCLELIKKPSARFWKALTTNLSNNNTSNGIDVCAGEVITFENLSVTNGGSPLYNYLWDFGDGTFSTEFEPSHVYTQTGISYWVTLTVTNSCNCVDTEKVQVHVGKKSVEIVCPSVVCEGQTATYKLSDLTQYTCEPFDWTVRGGSIISPQPYGNKIEVLWNGTGAANSTVQGFGYVRFNPSGCNLDCYVETNLKVPVITDNQRFEGPNEICEGSQYKYMMPQWPTTDFVWEVVNSGGTNATLIRNDQRNEIHLDPGNVQGEITLRVTYQNTLLNCGGSYERTIRIKVDAKISGPRETCLGIPVTYSIEEDEMVTWSLKLLPNGPTTFGIGTSFTTTFNTLGNYNLTISGPTVCNGDGIIIKVKGAETPVDQDILGSRIVCPSAPSTFTFNPSSQIAGTIVGWSVPPGVGTIVGSSYGNQAQVIFNYPTIPAGQPYTIKVWREILTASGCKSEEYTLNLAPENLDLAISGEQAPCGSTRYAYSLPNGIDADTFEWSIDPMDAGSIVTNGSASISVLWNQFSAPKNAVIRVKATKCNIPQTSLDYNVLIDNPTIALVAPTGPFCPDSNLAFSITSSVPLTVAPTNIIWEFGDNTLPKFGENVQHSYDLSGTYIIRVRVINPNGCTVTLTQTTTIVIEPLPVVTVTASNFEICAPNTTSSTLTAQPAAGVTILGWYLSGSGTSLGNSNSITVFNAGSYYVEVTNGTCTMRANIAVLGCPDPCTVPVVPGLSVSAMPSCVAISATSNFPSSPAPTSFTWRSNIFGDDLQLGSNINNATFSFEQPGNHVITFGVAYNNDQCYATARTTVFIPYVPKMGAVISCGTNNYILTISDQSLIDPSISPTYIFKVNGNEIAQGSNPANMRIVPLSGGTHTVEITISGGAYPCTVTKTIVIPVFPDAAFTVNPTVCQGSSAVFEVTNPVGGQVYWWNFGDVTFNYQQNPEKEYRLNGFYNPILTVSNAYCSATVTGDIEVLRNQQDGQIETPQIGCTGGSVNLSFSSNGNPPSTTYQWLLNNQPITGATANPYIAAVPGSYSIIVGASNLCTKRISQSVAVAFASPPFGAIQGPSTICENQILELYVDAGSQTTGWTFAWRYPASGNTIQSDLPTLSWEGLSVGTHTFTLTVTVPSGSGATCSTVLSHTVNVVSQPTVQALGTITDCDPFRVWLSATASEPDGFYNWSTGTSGANYEGFHGGAFQVTYTSENGCKASATIEVPKNPENYLWIFPQGCYSFCSDFTTGTLIGPSIAYFDKWRWLKNGEEAYYGGLPDQVQPYDLPSASNIYNLVLETSPCLAKSKSMTVDVIRCDNCNIEASGEIISWQQKPFIKYAFSLSINNLSTNALNIVVTAPNAAGVIIPSSISVPPGNHIFSFDLLPDAAFSGGNVIIRLQSNDSGSPCETDIEVYFPPIGQGSERLSADQNSQVSLRLVPNPAADQTRLVYDFGNGSLGSNRSVEVYDLYGRQLEQLIPTHNAASWEINTGVYQNGVYVIVMKQDGKIIQQKNLVITH